MRYVLIGLLLVAGACYGDRVTVQAGEVGKVLGPDGLESGLKRPSSFRLEHCSVGEGCEKLVRLQVALHAEDFTIDSLFLPKSNVDVDKVQVRIQFRVKEDKESVDRIFGEITPSKVGDSELLITSEQVYNTYLRGKVSDAILSTLRDYDVGEVLTQVPEISDFVTKQVNVALEKDPVQVTELSFPNGIGEVPKEVIEAKRLLFAVDEEKARQLKALAAELDIEAQRQMVQRTRAANDNLVAQELGIPVATFMDLKIRERFADAANEGTPVSIGGGAIPPAAQRGP